MAYLANSVCVQARCIIRVRRFLEKNCSNLIFSSWVPRVMRTNAEMRSLKLIPLLVPPQDANSQSANVAGVPSHRTSLTNAFLFNKFPLALADRLNASLIRRHSASDTKNERDPLQITQFIKINVYTLSMKTFNTERYWVNRICLLNDMR